MELAQEEMAVMAPMVLPRHIPASVVKLVTRSLHRLMKVKFGWGMLAGLQEAFTSFSQSKRVLVRFCS